jgi:hypothetical protein
MRKLVWIAILPLLLAAQEQKQEQKPAEKPAEAKQAEENKPEEPAAAEAPLSGTIDVGARWVSGIGGDFNTYRSIVNLGKGIRLMNMDLRYEPTAGKLVDGMMLQSYNWGGDPYNSARLDMKKSGAYRFLGNYSNIAYFNALPSFATPFSAQGVYLNQRAFDTAVRNMDNELQLFPGGRIIPYLAYSRNTMFGNGVSTLVSLGNEYPLRNLVRWGQDTYRGGVRLELKRLHATFEEGAISYKDDQAVASTERLTGNRTSPLFGQRLVLEAGSQAYWMRGDGYFTKVLVTMNPWDWIDIAGQFHYMNPKLQSRFSQAQAGTIAEQDPGIVFVNRALDTLTGHAQLPRTSGAASAEFRPFSRLRIREVYETDEFHDDSSSLITSQFTVGARPVSRSEEEIDRLDVTQHRQQIEGLVDAMKGLTLRGGYRREWGHALLRAGRVNAEPFERGEMKRHVVLAGAQARPMQRLTLNLDIESADGVKTYYRVGLMDSMKIRAAGRVTLPGSLFLNLLHHRFTNENPNEGVNYDFESISTSASLQWMPKGGKNLSILADYSRSAIRSDIGYLVPFPFAQARSLYRDNAHTGTLMADVTLPGKAGVKFTAGGSFVNTAGSRPSRYYQPIGRVLVPLHSKVMLYSEWRWYGLNQPYFAYEGFRSHLITTGLRILM